MWTISVCASYGGIPFIIFYWSYLIVLFGHFSVSFSGRSKDQIQRMCCHVKDLHSQHFSRIGLRATSFCILRSRIPKIAPILPARVMLACSFYKSHFFKSQVTMNCVSDVSFFFFLLQSSAIFFILLISIKRKLDSFRKPASPPCNGGPHSITARNDLMFFFVSVR